PPSGGPAPHARTRALSEAVEGPVSGQARAVLGQDLRRLPPEPRHRARRRGVGLRDRSRRTAGERRHAPPLGASGTLAPPWIARRSSPPGPQLALHRGGPRHGPVARE